MKNYFTFHNPHHISESCGSHKLALLPQKLVVESDLDSLSEADKLAVGVSAFFKGSSLRTAIFEHTQTILRNKVLKLISPSPTRWLTHGQCFERLIELLQPALVALNSLYTDKEDFKALGFLLGMIQSNFLLSCLALHDIFKVLSLLTHWLQTSPADADITRVPVLVKNTVEKLLYLSGEEDKKVSMTDRELGEMKFSLEVFEKLSNEVQEFVISTPIAGSSRNRRDATDSDDKEAVFEDFNEEVFKPFAKEMADNIEESLVINPVCRAFACLDVRNFPNSEEALEKFGEDDLKVLTDWYGVARRGVFPDERFEDQISNVDPIVNPGETRNEYKTFKKIMKSEQVKSDKQKQKSINDLEKKINKVSRNRNSGRDKRKVKGLEKEIAHLNQKEFNLSDVYLILRKQDVGLILPNIKTLVLLATLSPVGNAVVERLFSLLKITKTVLRNRMGDQCLDLLLRINKEAPETWTEENKEDLVDLWVDRKKRSGKEFKLVL